MISPVSNAAATMGLSTLAVVVALTAESTLVDLAIGCAGEGHAIVLQLDDSLGCLAGHVVDGVLVAEPIGALHSVVHVPLPVVVLHVSEGGVDASLCGDCVRSCGEKFCDDGGLEALGDQAESGTQASAT